MVRPMAHPHSHAGQKIHLGAKEEKITAKPSVLFGQAANHTGAAVKLF